MMSTNTYIAFTLVSGIGTRQLCPAYLTVVDDKIGLKIKRSDILYAAGPVIFVGDDVHFASSDLFEDIAQHASEHLQTLGHLKNEQKRLLI